MHTASKYSKVSPARIEMETISNLLEHLLFQYGTEKFKYGILGPSISAKLSGASLDI